ncbi:polyprenyl synthetase family protein [Clostridium sp. DL1XJH146]
MSEFWKEYTEIYDELNDVTKIMKKNIKTSEDIFKDSIGLVMDNSGKMLRPAFVLLAGKFGNYEAEKSKNLAAAIEMLHTATLIHDDIVDEAKLRRGIESVQSNYGKDFAVYAGDYLLCQCFNLLTKYDYTMENLSKISKAMSRICRSEINQHYFRYNSDVSLKKYIRVISGKTAALFALSFVVGSKEAECDENTVKLLGKIGYNLGMAFQIIDDLLDFTVKEKKLGKSAQNDLKQGYYTLPLILAMKEDSDKEIASILDKSIFISEDIKAIINLVEKHNGIKGAKQVADRYTNRALMNIEKLPECESKEIIKEVVEKLLRRQY